MSTIESKPLSAGRKRVRKQKPKVKSEGSASLKFSFVRSEDSKRTGSLKPSVSASLFGALLALVYAGGIGACLYTQFAPASDAAVLLVVLALFTLVFYRLWSASFKMRVIGLAVVAAWIIGFGFLMGADIGDGFKQFANHVGALWGARNGRIAPAFFIGVTPENYEFTATLFLMIPTVLLALFCSYASSRTTVGISLILDAVILFAAWFFESYPPLWALLLLLLSQAVLLAIRLKEHPAFLGRLSRATFVGQALLTVVVAVVLGAFLWFAPTDYSAFEEVQQLRNTVISDVNAARFGNEVTRSMPDGDFSRLGMLELSEESALEVSMEKPDSLWLRGFVGGDYKGNGWEETDSQQLYESSDLFYWLHQANFYGQTQFADISQLLDEELEEQTIAMGIKNVGASSRSIYTPYELLWADAELCPEDGIGDASLYSEGFTGNREYQYLSLTNQVKRYPTLTKMLYEEENKDASRIKNYLLVESYYADFAQENYLAINDEVRQSLDQVFASYMPDEEELTYTEAKRAIIDCLSNTVRYSTTAEPAERGSDFIVSFLEGTQAGYSVHYASAATMMFRYCDIPARYVEGYLITPNDVKDVAENSTITLDGTHAHAWVEIYIAGLGWVPMEVTPAYFGVMEEPETYEGAPGTNDQKNDRQDDSSIVSDARDLDEKNRRGFNIAPFILAFLLAAFVVATTIILLRRRALIKKRARVFADSDNNAAIVALFNYELEILYAEGLVKDGVLLLNHLMEGIAPLDSKYANEFGAAFALYEAAVYSGVQASDEQRRYVSELKDKLLEELKEKTGMMKKIKLRLFKALY